MTRKSILEIRDLLFGATGVGIQVEDNFSDASLLIRSDDPDFFRPHGWNIQVDELSEITIYSFSFDNNAKPLQDLFILRCLEVQKTLKEEQEKLSLFGLQTRISSNGKEITIEEFSSELKIENITIHGKYIHKNEEFPDSHNEAISALILFVGFCLIPLIPNPEENDQELDEVGLPEGAQKKVIVNRYERNPRNRAACIAFYGTTCQGCDFDFGKAYGPLGVGFIHVHHIVPVSQIGPNYVVNPTRDLVPLCPNCHAVIHLKNPPLSVDELKSIFRKDAK